MRMIKNGMYNCCICLGQFLIQTSRYWASFVIKPQNIFDDGDRTCWISILDTWKYRDDIKPFYFLILGQRIDKGKRAVFPTFEVPIGQNFNRVSSNYSQFQQLQNSNCCRIPTGQSSNCCRIPTIEKFQLLQNSNCFQIPMVQFRVKNSNSVNFWFFPPKHT